MIVQEGFKGLSMQKLARQAGISPATIYIYYKDRNDLLHQLYQEVLERSNAAALKNFDPDMNFADGLKLLWHNRYQYFLQHPDEFHFISQFINSPMIRHSPTEEAAYSHMMQTFYQNAIKAGELTDLPLEALWPVAFAPLYQLIHFSLQKSVHPRQDMHITPAVLDQSLAIILKGLKP